MQSSLKHNARLHWFAVLTAIATLGLVGLGGLVTSHEAGMAVRDWPNTYGYNMFFFPVSRWVGGIFYEHTHRLAASAVGMLTAILALWLYGRSARWLMRWTGVALLACCVATCVGWPQRRPDAMVLGLSGLAFFGGSHFWPQCEASAKWLRRLGLAAFAAVVLQGVLGGLRVVLFKDEIGIFHAMLAQLFFALVCVIALCTSRWWENRGVGEEGRGVGFLERGPDRSGSYSTRSYLTKGGAGALQGKDGFWFLLLGTTLLILAQLAIGATMRHQHAGLAIRDFPAAYGKLWPAMDAASVERYNQQRMEVTSVKPITALQIGLQMAHRIMAVLILVGVGLCVWSTRQYLGRERPASRLALIWLGLVLAQAALGAATIWSNKAADVATGHVLAGALSLALGAMACVISFGEVGLARAAKPVMASGNSEAVPYPRASLAHGGDVNP